MIKDVAGKRLLVVGSNGFLGSHIVCRLNRPGAIVINAYCKSAPNWNPRRGWDAVGTAICHQAS